MLKRSPGAGERGHGLSPVTGPLRTLGGSRYPPAPQVLWGELGKNQFQDPGTSLLRTPIGASRDPKGAKGAHDDPAS